jgi:hypothetical protein
MNKQTKMFALATRAAGTDPLEVEVTLSTGGVDRENDTINSRGWQLDSYMRNPIVLAHHDYKSLPVARMERLAVVGDKLVGRVRFPEPGTSPRADEVRQLTTSRSAQALGAHRRYRHPRRRGAM